MTNPQVIIGSNFGDESKGVWTDYLANSKKSDCVIRFNGTAQAGHTVQLKDGRRHVFSHLGSGTFAGASTFLSKFFYIHPILFYNEMDEFLKANTEPVKIFADPKCPLITPYEVWLNREVERQRGDSRHGSVGVGFGEAVERELAGHHLSFQDIICNSIEEKISNIFHSGYWHKRADQLGLDVEKFDQFLQDQDELNKFLALSQFHTKEHIKPANKPVGRKWIFEGAQGLMLDEEYGELPYVTWSSTGLKNVLELCAEWEVKKLDVWYITRAYLTRHGAGPFQDETECPDWMIDQTNKPSEFQGSLRYAPFTPGSVQSFQARTRSDFAQAKAAGIDATLNYVVSCLDQTDGKLILKSLQRNPDIYQVGTSFGPTRETAVVGRLPSF